jgi:hypothetical protein
MKKQNKGNFDFDITQGKAKYNMKIKKTEDDEDTDKLPLSEKRVSAFFGSQYSAMGVMTPNLSSP